ncbi:unnamed protein product [Dovyalis caffra]|uniref:Ribosomal protein S4 n=1 Tax=Dovyalis caffra TaxID=77055 RepID=A0AAV1RT45_9ROSI|nr:unnamed protein product [Dovyalis caffra]
MAYESAARRSKGVGRKRIKRLFGPIVYDTTTLTTTSNHVLSNGDTNIAHPLPHPLQARHLLNLKPLIKSRGYYSSISLKRERAKHRQPHLNPLPLSKKKNSQALLEISPITLLHL